MRVADLYLAGVITAKERDVLELRDDHGFSQRTIALALNLSRSSVRSREESARRKIRLHQQKEAA